LPSMVAWVRSMEPRASCREMRPSLLWKVKGPLPVGMAAGVSASATFAALDVDGVAGAVV
jgi:hypothetical protein